VVDRRRDDRQAENDTGLCQQARRQLAPAGAGLISTVRLSINWVRRGGSAFDIASP